MMVGSKASRFPWPRFSNLCWARVVKNIRQLFDRDNPADSFVITDDFVSSGRISGAKSIPIFRLKFPHEWRASGCRWTHQQSGISANWLTFSASF